MQSKLHPIRTYRFKDSLAVNKMRYALRIITNPRILNAYLALITAVYLQIHLSNLRKK